MDVTPRELRDTDIREGFRGYHRDDVDELLERAASTVEGLTERVRQLTERLQSVEGSAGKSRETEDMLQRTLVLAQKTADEAIAEAEERARTLVEESEAKARHLVDAEGTARRVAENERARLESEVQDLSARRDALNADVEALERYEKEYRTRLRRAIESELDSLGKFSAQHGQRPKLHDVSVPPPREAVANSGRPSPSPSQSPGSSSSPPLPTAEIGAVDPFPKAPAESTRGAPAADSEPDWSAMDAPASEPAAKPEAGSTPGMADFVPADEPVEPEVLDDDAFFATLREAVRDDAPLGPRDDEDDVYEEDNAPRKRGWGRRR
jgi:cell division septum initiation protein DivIVA